MGKLKTSASFYRRGIPNSQNGFGGLVNNNFSIVEPIYLFRMPVPLPKVIQNNILIQNGQVLYLDAGNKSSYNGIGDIWTNLGLGGATYNTRLITDASGGDIPTFQNNNSASYFSFDGTNQFAYLLRPVQDSFSWCVLFNTTQIAGDPDSSAWYANNNPQIIGGDVNGTTNDYGVSIGVGTLFFGIGESGGIDVTINTNTLPTYSNFNNGNWHYLVATRNIVSGLLQLYVDGILFSSVTAGTNVLNSSTHISVACEEWNLANFFQGKIAVIQAYNRVLSASEINYNYNILQNRYN